MPIPEIVGQGQYAGIKQVAVFQYLVVEIILGFESQRARFNAHVDVLADQDHRAIRLLFLQPDDHAENCVVGFAQL